MPKNIIVTSNNAYIRFHGQNYSTKYNFKELKYYAERLVDLSVERIYAYFNNDKNAYAIQNALQFREVIPNP